MWLNEIKTESYHISLILTYKFFTLSKTEVNLMPSLTRSDVTWT